jgi:3-methylfumaryl-CoA hydratase
MTGGAPAETDFSDWVGRSEETTAEIAAYQADAMAATLDRDDPPFAKGDPIPPNWHLFYMREVVKLADTAPDGHPKRGGFMPPVPLPRRMWAGTKSTFHAPIRVGDTIRRVSTIDSVTPKSGKSGRLCFVTVRHEIANADGPCVTELHNTVYRDASQPGAAAPAPPPRPMEPAWRRDIHPSAVLLFRFSALTMNSHRIHYDWKYVTEVEGYPGLLVHGPLTQTLLFDLFRRERPEATLKTFDVRAISPLYDTHDFAVEGAPGADGRSATLWAVNHQGGLAMTAEATFEE